MIPLLCRNLKQEQQPVRRYREQISGYQRGEAFGGVGEMNGETNKYEHLVLRHIGHRDVMHYLGTITINNIIILYGDRW